MTVLGRLRRVSLPQRRRIRSSVVIKFLVYKAKLLANDFSMSFEVLVQQSKKKTEDKGLWAAYFFHTCTLAGTLIKRL